MSLNGGDIIADVFRSRGVTHVFGNPGSTEMPFIDAVTGAGDIHYVLGLHECSVIGMAEGYAMASGKPAVVNVHTLSGLGNSIGMLTNAKGNGTPLVVTAGHQHNKLLVGDPLLSHDLTGMTRTVSKWQHEVRHVDELGVMVQRAFNDVLTPPRGPVFLSLPVSLFSETSDLPVPGPSAVDQDAVAGGLDQMADLLVEAGPSGAAIVLAFNVAQEDAVSETVLLAERLGVDVYSAPITPMGVFPPGHALWKGMLSGRSGDVREKMSRYRRVLFIGGQAFQQTEYTTFSALPEDVELLHLSSDAYWVGRLYPTRYGAIGGLKASIAALADAVARCAPAGQAERLQSAGKERADMIARVDAHALSAYGPAPVMPEAAVHAALRGAPADIIVVDEAVSNSHYIHAHHHWTKPGRLFSARQIIGWGMPAAVGVALAHGGREPILSITSDGGATFSPQAVWTAARENLPVTFVVLVNREYGILKKYLKALGGHAVSANDMRSVELIDPPIDYVLQARSYGVDAHRVASADELSDAVRAATGKGKPTLIEVPMAVV